ncbi:MAG: hypothetical protein R2748_28385 [Bryobacterales bacterium]
MFVAATLFAAIAATADRAPWIDPADDAKHFGGGNPLVWTLDQKVAGFRNYDKLFPSRTVPAGPYTLGLPASGSL